MNKLSRGFDVSDAEAYLRRIDKKLGIWMDKIGPILPDPRWKKPFDVSDALARAILYQQLSGKAAATIVGRVEIAISSDKLHADTLGRVDDTILRGCGVSANKLLALRDLMARAECGEIPDVKRMQSMSDDAIVAALVPVRGIGRWTVEMMLMFRLGRPDILPIDDLGIRKGAQCVDKRSEMQTPRALAARGEQWRPYRTYASLYLWRVADFNTQQKSTKVPLKRSQD